MELDEPCVHLLDPRTCTTCLHGVTPPPEPEAVQGLPFRARYDGTCLACGDPITKGVDTIVRTNRDRYLHLECMEDL